MADPQFGMFSSLSGLSEEQLDKIAQMGLRVRPAPKITGFADETALYDRAIAAANALAPDFVVLCGDMVNDYEDSAQHAEVSRITRKLHRDVPLHWVAGNHDVGDAPTAESLRLYRARYGEDNYVFRHKGSCFIVLNSCVCYDPSNVPDEWEQLLQFLTPALRDARESASGHVVVFTHHPLFVETPDDEDGWAVIPRARRRVLLDEFHASGVSAVFSGHLHMNRYASDGDLEMVASGPVGYPMGDDPSGIRVVKVLGDRVEHDYYGFDNLPNSVELD